MTFLGGEICHLPHTHQNFLQISKTYQFFPECLLRRSPISPTGLSTALSRCPLYAQARGGVPSQNLIYATL